MAGVCDTIMNLLYGPSNDKNEVTKNNGRLISANGECMLSAFIIFKIIPDNAFDLLMPSSLWS